MEIVCTSKKVYRGFESLSLRQGPLAIPGAWRPQGWAALIAGSCATKDYQLRQVRKEAAAVIPSCAAGVPSYQHCPPLKV